MKVTTAHKWLQLPDSTVALYNAHDTIEGAKLRHALRREMENNKQRDFYFREVAPNIPSVLGMSARGLYVDTNARAEDREEILSARDDIEAGLCDYAGMPRRGDGPFWLQSPKAKAEVLFNTLALRPAPPTRERPPRSTGHEALDYIHRHLRKMDEPHRPFIEDLFHWSKLNQLVRYLDFPIEEDGRCRPTIKMAKQKTMRLSYTDPPLAQWPSRGYWVKLRRMFCAAPNLVLLGADYSQLELRVLAVLADDKPLLEAFADDTRDVHAENAQDFLGLADWEWASYTPEQKRMARDWAKSAAYKMIYGGDPGSDKGKQFCPCHRCDDERPPEVEISGETKAKAGKRWFARHPAVRRFRQRLASEVRRNHTYTDPLGGKRYFMSPWGADLEREVYDFPMQRLATAIKDRARRALHDAGAPLWFDHHDALYLEVRAGEEHAWASKLVAAMEMPVAELGSYSFPVEVKSGPNWYELEKT